MIEGTINDKDEIVGEALTYNEIFCIGNEGTMTDHHTFRLARGACGVKDIRDAVRNIRSLQTGLYFLEEGLGHAMLQRSCDTTSEMGGKVGDQEIYVLRGAKAMDIVAR